MPDSPLNKKIKNAKIKLKRAEERKLDAYSIAKYQAVVDALMEEKTLHMVKHNGF